mmetsp:Transcript_137855/g.384384  ORF Transcript_137855/g.384384 Transcript_137855/m.384384 type:complete len:225 (+) Transcript_137855:42-716(+)
MPAPVPLSEAAQVSGAVHYVKYPGRGLCVVQAGEMVTVSIESQETQADLDNDICVLANMMSSTEWVLDSWDFLFENQVLKPGTDLRDYGIKEGSSLSISKKKVGLRRTPGLPSSATSERLRRKLLRRQDVRPIAAPPSQGVAEPVAGDEDMCVVCLCTPSECGRPIHWVFEKCGHKCVCKPCLRKMKAKGNAKNGAVECPMCREWSKPVIEERYRGDDVFSAGA